MINTDGSGETLLIEGWMDWIFWNHDGSRIYYSQFHGVSNGYTLHYLDLESRQSTQIIAPTSPTASTFAVEAANLSPNDEYLVYFVNSTIEPNSLQVIRTADNRTVAAFPGSYATWTADSRYLVVTNLDGEWFVLDVDTGQSIPLAIDVQAGAQIVGWLR
jgi:hypothetical protein